MPSLYVSNHAIERFRERVMSESPQSLTMRRKTIYRLLRELMKDGELLGYHSIDPTRGNQGRWWWMYKGTWEHKSFFLVVNREGTQGITVLTEVQTMHWNITAIAKRIPEPVQRDAPVPTRYRWKVSHK